jgi:uncharacterized coiled-coil protein SlyX
MANEFKVKNGLIVDAGGIQVTGGITGSIAATNGVVSGSSQITSIANSQLTNNSITIAGQSTALGGTITLATITGGSGIISSSTSLPTGVVSGSSQISLAGTSDYTSLFGGIGASTSSLNTFSASNANTSLNTFTASNFTSQLNLFTSSAALRLTNLETTTASLNISVTNLNSYSASVSNSIGNINAYSTSVSNSIQQLNTFTASNANTSLNAATASFAPRITNLETTSASVNISVSNLNTFTASNANTSLNTYTGSNDTTNTTQNSRLTNLETTSASVNISVSSLNTVTSSLATTYEGRASTTKTLFSGSIQVLGSSTVLSGSNSITIAGSSTPLGGTITLATITGGSGIVSGSIQVLGSSTIHSGSANNYQFNSIGVGVAASATAGRIDASNDIVAFSSSDIRFKENIKPIENALQKISKISGNTYDWKAENKIEHGYEGNDVGVIAQEIEEVLPQLVQTRENGYKAVKYDKLVALLIEGIKEQQTQIHSLTLEIEKLKEPKGL